MSDRSTEIFGKLQEEISKFDYFICSVSGAVFAYSLPNFVPGDFSTGLVPWLEPVGLGLIALSFWLGLKRIEAVIEVKRANFQILEYGNNIVALNKALLEPGASLSIDLSSGRQFSPEQLVKDRDAQLAKQKEVKASVPKKHRISQRFYSLRNACLLLGFAFLFAAKTLGRAS